MPANLASSAFDSGAPADLLQALLATSLAGVVLYTPVYGPAGEVVDFAYAYLNPVAQQVLRLPAQPAGTYVQLFSESLENEGFAFHRDTFQAGTTGHFQLHYQAQGFDTYFRITARRVGEQLLVNFIASADTEGRPAVEEALRQSQAREQEARLAAERERNLLHAVLAQAPVAIGLFQGDSQVVATANEQLCAMWGYVPEQVVGKPLLEGVPELRGQGFTELMAEVARTRVPFVGTEVPADLLQQGRLERHYFNFVYQPLYDAAGGLLGVLDIAIDVTTQVASRQQVQVLNEELAATNEELQATNSEFMLANTELTHTQQALHQLNQQLEARVAERTQQMQQAQAEAAAQRNYLQRVFEQAPVAIATMRGPSLLVESANAAVGAIWGRLPSQVVGRPYFEAVPDTSGQGFEQILADVLATGQPFTITEAPVQLARAHTGQPTLGYVNFVFQPLYDEQPLPTGLIAIGTEVTDQVLARQQVDQSRARVQELNDKLATINEELQATNEELGDTNQQLTRTNADLDNFIYTASHDLKAPITNIEGLLLALQNELPPASRVGDLPHILHLMQDSIDRFKRTIEHLTDVSRLQKEHDQTASPVRLAEVIENVRLDLAPLIAEAHAQLDIDVPDSETLTFSEKNLRSVVYNLLSNALKYRHPGRVPRIRLRTRLHNPYLVLEVQDNGLGLDLTRERGLFGMFQRYHTHVEGSGIGLYMVKKMVENAGGRIEVESQPDHGTTFFVYFPR